MHISYVLFCSSIVHTTELNVKSFPLLIEKEIILVSCSNYLLCLLLFFNSQISAICCYRNKLTQDKNFIHFICPHLIFMPDNYPPYDSSSTLLPSISGGCCKPINCNIVGATLLNPMPVLKRQFSRSIIKQGTGYTVCCV